jgi:hypothetical protein
LIASTFSGYGIDLSGMLQLSETVVLKYALWLFDRGLNPPIYWVYFGVITMMFMSWCSVAYVIV